MKNPYFKVILLWIGMIIMMLGSYVFFDPKSTVPNTSDSDQIYPPVEVTGVINPTVTQENIQDTICKSGWTATIRPTTSYTNALKVSQLKKSGHVTLDGKYLIVDPTHYEEDHFISLELGGNPTDEKNLWPEPYNPLNSDGGAHQKDFTENYLHRQVCAGQMSLSEAQKEIMTDWYAVYQRIHGTLGAAVSNLDQDDE